MADLMSFPHHTHELFNTQRLIFFFRFFFATSFKSDFIQLALDFSDSATSQIRWRVINPPFSAIPNLQSSLDFFLSSFLFFFLSFFFF